ncbi:transcription termination factor MTERF15, mitochondrial-like [Senna tora]|uniref:Transcription termination factor MTERF15, mitochondrial-like n=1 Tax=Senna tora TaxID=362788 RepID=A0A834W9U8_9FABA|nr:transcription termination factor MTERF15, mitochondrial-like [Senna tora]
MLNFLITRLSSSLPFSTRTQLGFLHRNASRTFNPFSSVAKLSESKQETQKQVGNDPFTVSYLMNSLGMSSNVAIEVSKRVQLKGPENPDSVLILLRSYGFSDTQISRIARLFPKVLSANPEKTLLPKLRFIQSIGFSSSELPQLVSSNCIFLSWSLKKRIIPLYEALKSVLDEDQKVNIVLKCPRWTSVYNEVTNVVPNIKILREHGVPQSSVTLLVASYSSIAFMNHSKLVEHVKFAKELGIEPFRATYIDAIHVLSITKKSTWESKLDIYERCGWSRDVTLSVFRKYPLCMVRSEEKIMSTMKFLVDEMHMTPEELAKCPAVLGYSLKQRIIPRCSVVQFLKMKGLLNNDNSLYYFLKKSEKEFVEKFVVRFQESVPQLLSIYKGHVEPVPQTQ